jgi:hypothetical protein
MTALATVKYIINGYTVSGGDPAATPPVPYVTHYAAALVEVPYWIAQILGVPAGPPPPSNRETGAVRTVADPYLNQLALVSKMTDGGFLVRAEPSVKFGTPPAEEFCTDMDAVSAALTKIYTYTPPP